MLLYIYRSTTDYCITEYQKASKTSIVQMETDHCNNHTLTSHQQTHTLVSMSSSTKHGATCRDDDTRSRLIESAEVNISPQTIIGYLRWGFPVNQLHNALVLTTKPEQPRDKKTRNSTANQTTGTKPGTEVDLGHIMQSDVLGSKGHVVKFGVKMCDNQSLHAATLTAELQPNFLPHDAMLCVSTVSAVAQCLSVHHFGNTQVEYLKNGAS